MVAVMVARGGVRSWGCKGVAGAATTRDSCVLSVYLLAWGLRRLFLLYAYLLSLVGWGFPPRFPPS